MSKQKDLINKIIKESMLHLTAEEIFTLARKEMPNISLGTVYRNLSVLNDEKEIRKFTNDGTDFYDKSWNPHGHIICPCCGKIDDYNSSLITQILTKDLNEFISYQLTISKKCNNCKNIKDKGDY